MHCVTSVRPASPVVVLLPCFENRMVLFFVAFWLLFHRNQERNLKWENQTANNCCKVFKCIWMFFLICMWLCNFCKWLFWYVYFGLRKIKVSFHLISESFSLFSFYASWNLIAWEPFEGSHRRSNRILSIFIPAWRQNEEIQRFSDVLFQSSYLKTWWKKCWFVLGPNIGWKGSILITL